MNYIREAMQTLPGHWSQGYLGDGDGNFCGIGHLNVAMGGDKTYGWLPYENYEVDAQQRAIRNVLDKIALEQYPDRMARFETRDYTSSFAAFNDHRDTTEAEVLAIMEKAAIRWDEQV